jgi:uncharacterized protein
MGYLTFQARINELRRQTPRIILFGGEPFLQENTVILERVFKECYDRNVKITIITNGIVIGNFVSLLNKYRELLIDIVITIDGPTEVHDMRRQKIDGTGSFKDICRSITVLLKNCHHVTSQIMIDWDNIYSISELLLFIKSMKWDKSPYFSIVAGRVMFPGNRNLKYKYEIADEDFIKCFFNLAKLDANFSLLTFSVGELQPYSHFYRVLNGFTGTLPKLHGCEAIYPGVKVLEPDGFVYPCTQLTSNPTFAIDNYLDNKLFLSKTKWNDSLPLNIKECRGCKYVTICGGGCRAKALIHNPLTLKPYCPHVKEILTSFVDTNSKELLECLSKNI